MIIKSIELKNFRNYENLHLDFDSNVNFIIGDNGQGKTNLIEGIFMSSIGKSFRTSKDNELINFNSDFTRIFVVCEKEIGEQEVEIIIKNGEGKNIKLNGVQVRKSSDLLNNIYIVVFSPEDLKIVKDEPDKRRKFIDRELSILRASYYNNFSNYKKVLLQRNAYLKEDNIETSVLDIWNIELAKYGSKVIKARDEFIKKINLISKEIHKNITNGQEDLEIKYNPNVPFEYWEENEFLELIKKEEINDIRNRNTGVGPHRDDLDFYINGIDVRSFGSQGQQRTTALSLKLAELELIKEETGENAILLLDDVMSELDQTRQTFLIKSLKGIQVFITSAEMTDNLRDSIKPEKVFKVKNGEINL